MSPNSEDELKGGATGESHGDVETFLRLFGAHRQRLFRFIVALLPSLHDAEDVLQETNVVLWRKFNEYQSGTNFLAWATQIARFEVLKHRRSHARTGKFLPLDHEVMDQLAEDVRRNGERLDGISDAFHRCVQRLSAADQELLRLCYSTGSTAKAVAAELGRPANSVYKSLGRIRQALLGCVKRKLRLADLPGGAS